MESASVNKRKHIKVFISLGVLFLLSVALITVFLFQNRNNPLKEYKSSVNFSLFYPDSMPKGYYLDEESVKLEEDILFFGLTNSDDRINISQQASPDIEIDQLFNKEEPPVSIETRNGRLIIVESVQGRNAILVTGDSWINISATWLASRDDIEQLANNFVEIR